MIKIEPVTLAGTLVRLEPLEIGHATSLLVAGQDPAIWRYLPLNASQSLSTMERWINEAIEAREAGSALPFAIIDQQSGEALGSTRLFELAAQQRGLEIGWTWLTTSVQRTGVNTECKYLLLRHCFETLGAIRVQLKTHHENFRSQRAIERLGAVKEGILRNHMIMPDQSYRHSVFYSIIESEWPVVKARLEAKMSSGSGFFPPQGEA